MCGDDAALVRAVAAARANLGQASKARALLRRRFDPEPASSPKDLLAATPVDDIDLTRSRDTGRAIDL